MSEQKNFLSRWSERKLHPETEKPAPEREDDALNRTDELAGGLPAKSAGEFDISTLPPLDSITANSDIRAFLQRGVPAELTRAALRRAWSADPAIRDFVGLSENSWDFNAPDSIPGFGSFTSEELQQAVKQFFSGAVGETQGQAPQGSSDESGKISPEKPGKKSDSKADASAVARNEPADAAPQQRDAAEPINSPRQIRRHGGALPE